jgi:hypothetical protein
METVEESGAGDAFTAGLIKGIVENWELSDALGLASAVGASCTRAPGCYASIFTFDQAVAFLKNPQTGHASLSRLETGYEPVRSLRSSGRQECDL